MAKGHRKTAKSRLRKASKNLDKSLNYLMVVLNYAGEDDHPDIAAYLDKVMESIYVLKKKVDDLEHNL